MDPTNGIPETSATSSWATVETTTTWQPLKGVYQGAASSSLGVIVEMSRTH